MDHSLEHQLDVVDVFAHPDRKLLIMLTKSSPWALVLFTVCLGPACSSGDDGDESSTASETGSSQDEAGTETDTETSTETDTETGTETDTDSTTDTSDTDSTDTGSTEDDPYEAARAACVDRINAFRATEGLPPYERWEEEEGCVDDQAAADSVEEPHANFGDCHEFAQNTCPGWGSAEEVVQTCLQSMWDEGPGEDFSKHGHYLNMSNPDYTHVACGFFEMENGDIWANQNFK